MFFVESKYFKLPRNRRVATGARNTVDMETVRKISKLFSELKPQLCHSNGVTCPPGSPGLPGPKGDKGSRGRRGQKGRTKKAEEIKALWDRLE